MKSFREQFGPNPSGEVLQSAFNMKPEALMKAVDYLDRFAGSWVFDPSQIVDSEEDLARGDIKQAADTLYEYPNGAELNAAFRYNLDALAHGEKREGDARALLLRSIFKETGSTNEGEIQIVDYSTEQVIDEVVGDPTRPSIMTTALITATGAKLLRDDFQEEGNRVGMRAYRGILRNSYVYFSESIDRRPKDRALMRSLWAEPESSLRQVLSELSVADDKIWKDTGLRFPGSENPGAGQEGSDAFGQLTREAMVRIIRMYQAMNM